MKNMCEEELIPFERVNKVIKERQNSCYDIKNQRSLQGESINGK